MVPAGGPGRSPTVADAAPVTAAWSPLRPKSITFADEHQNVVAAPVDQTVTVAKLAVSTVATAAKTTRLPWHPAAPARTSFELPDNVSRRPYSRPLRGAAAAEATADLGVQHKRPASQAKGRGKGKGEQQQPPKKKPRYAKMRGPDRAAALKKARFFQKKSVSRRVALWRTRVVDGERQTTYVTFAGETLPKNGGGFRTAKADERFLKQRGIASNKPQGSSIDRPEEMEPYASRRGTDPRNLAYWCLPESVIASYRDVGVRQLHVWQAECLAGPGVLEGRSLVYVAPTSAGKTLVSEVIMLRQLLFRGRRALLVLPYVSLCMERMDQLRRLWSGCGIRVEGLYSSSEGSWHGAADVGVCTIERASSLLNKLLEDDSLLRDIGVIVVDEMHILGDEHRGYLLELILIKARLSATSVAVGDPARSLQIIGMSATLPNVSILSDWLEAHLHIAVDRPVPLSLSIASKGQVVETSGSQTSTQQPQISTRPRDPDGLVPLVAECVSEGKGVLVFCATKDWCEKAAILLAEELPAALGAAVVSPERVDSRLRVVEELRHIPAGLCPFLARSLPQGVAYHHAGLTAEERTIIEGAYRSGTINCLCATSTLAAGVNLPARRVIIRSMKVGNSALDPVRFRQMAGRAGRKGFDVLGECVVMTKSGPELAQAREMFAAELAPLRSSLAGQRLIRAVLEVVSLGLVRTAGMLHGAFANSLLRFREEAQIGSEGAPDLAQELDDALQYLEGLHLLRVDRSHAAQHVATACCTDSTPVASPNLAAARLPPEASLLATPLGDGVVHSSMSPTEAIRVFEDLQKSRSGIHLDTDLHLVYLTTPVNTHIDPDWNRLLALYERLPARERGVAEAVGVSHEFIVSEALGRRGPLPGGSSGENWRLDRERQMALHRRFWAALALCELLGERPLAKVAKAYGIPRGALQSLQQIAATYCGMVRQLCERLRWHEMAALFESLMPRMTFGVSADILPLCQIGGVYPARARALLEAGFETPEDIARGTLDALEATLRRLHQFESKQGSDSAAAERQELVVRSTSRQLMKAAQDHVGKQLQQVEDEAEEERLRVSSALYGGHHVAAQVRLQQGNIKPNRTGGAAA